MRKLDPTIYNWLEEVNRPYECSLCGQPGKNSEERLFIKEMGFCYSCEKTRAEIQQDCAYDELKEQQMGL